MRATVNTCAPFSVSAVSSGSVVFGVSADSSVEVPGFQNMFGTKASSLRLGVLANNIKWSQI